MSQNRIILQGCGLDYNLMNVTSSSKLTVSLDSQNLDSLSVLNLLTTPCADHTVRSFGHLEPMTSSTHNTKEQEWQTFHYCPTIVLEGEINYKNTTNSKDNTNVLYCVRTSWLFFPLLFPQGSLDQSGITLVQFALHLKSHCLLELDLPDSFTQWMDSPSSAGKKTHSMWNCLRSHEVLDLSGTSLSTINLPIVRMSSLQGSIKGSWRGCTQSWTLKQRSAMQMRKKRERRSAQCVLKEEAPAY